MVSFRGHLFLVYLETDKHLALARDRGLGGAPAIGLGPVCRVATAIYEKFGY
jgi:hypothetical protein